jgi:hypothetical protein
MNYRLALLGLLAGSCSGAAAFSPKAFGQTTKKIAEAAEPTLWTPRSASMMTTTKMVAGGAERGTQDEYYDGEFMYCLWGFVSLYFILM